MFTNHQHREIHPRTRIILAVTIGLLIAILATIWIFLPATELLAQFPFFSPLARAAIIVKILSPLLSFALTGGWVWVLLLLAEQWLSSQESKENTSPLPPHQESILQEPQPRYQLEHSTTPLESRMAEGPSRTRQRERMLAVPSLFQLDPTWHYDQLPFTPLPLPHPTWSPITDPAEQDKKQGKDGEESRQENLSIPQFQILSSQSIDLPQTANERPESAQLREVLSLEKPEERQKPITMTLLKQVSAYLHADDGTTVEIKLRGGENAIRLIQLAYIAWRMGASVDRDKLFTHVIGRGKRRDMNTDQLGEVFDSAKRYLRKNLEKAVNELKEQGHPIKGELDFFSNEPGFYWLHPCCRVVDLEKIEASYRIILVARKNGLLDEKLDGSLPDWVVQACQDLINAYTGDFLQSLLEKFPDEFGPWVKEPVTLYRDRYLEALLLMANYESALGRNTLDTQLSAEQNEEQRRHHSGKAALLFYDYAMYAINAPRWDQKLKFEYRSGKDGERVVRSARAMRRCVVELGKLGNPDMIDQAYFAFKERMSTLSEGTWKPDRDTESDVAEAKRTTSAYRFSFQTPTHQEKNKS